MCKDYTFELGMEFTSISQFKEAVREHSLMNGYETMYIKNDSVRCRINCVCCDWLMFVSKERDSMTYRLKTYNSRHTCGVTFSSGNVSSKWVAGKIKSRMKTNKNMSLGDVISTIREDYMADVSIPKAYWARRKAKQDIEGDFVDEYKRLWDYNNEVLSKSPESTFKILTDRPFIDKPPRFKRAYICLDAVKKGFLAVCRPIIGLDGCFLKGPYGGILLVAVVRDPNEQYFPLAVAVVEGENRDSWSWFLDHILNDVGTTQRWVFISDQQKGLMPTFESLLPEVEHRLCVRHLYSNIKTRYGGGTVIRDLVMQAAKATYINGWKQKMHELKNRSKEANDHLMKFPPQCWTKSHFTEYPKCDIIMNNILESFNGRLLEAQELPIIGLLEWIRTYIMTRFQKNRRRAEKFRSRGSVCQNPRRRLDKEVSESRKWVAEQAGEFEFEVSYYSHKFSVDLAIKSCSCRWWNLTGIACRHVVSAIYAKRGDPHDYVHPCLKIDAYVECYSHAVKPINGREMWEATNKEEMDPSSYHRRPGRPRKLRKRASDEPSQPNKRKRTNSQFRCTFCHNYGHNKRTCTSTRNS